MKIVKKFSKFIFGFILGCIVSGGIVYAAYSTDSTAVSYSPNGNDSQMKSVQDALDELYAKSENAASANGTLRVNFAFSAILKRTGTEANEGYEWGYYDRTSSRGNLIVDFVIENGEVVSYTPTSSTGTTGWDSWDARFTMIRASASITSVEWIPAE